MIKFLLFSGIFVANFVFGGLIGIYAGVKKKDFFENIIISIEEFIEKIFKK